ncbi:MAG TPA: hypothetical protein VFV67_17080 [Actinophytocola sp.]|uniref:hypothetical protein n=1 Tax=Actinophytocola sp. TaxID=1872138 RepID=UPI002DB5FEF5|nr:hypothetical protein [Actinophytocola sp.]HEU5472368.1 hypothetical protein [Actinophytocola sp.]
MTHPQKHHHHRVMGLDPERAIYGTVVLMSVLAVYTGWEGHPHFLGIAVVIVLPTLALMLAHLFAGSMTRHMAVRRALTRPEWRQLLRDDAEFLLVAIPPITALGISWLSPLDVFDTIGVILGLGTLNLAGWGFYAGYRAGMTGWRLFASALAGGGIGVLVIAIQIVFKPH